MHPMDRLKTGAGRLPAPFTLHVHPQSAEEIKNENAEDPYFSGRNLSAFTRISSFLRTSAQPVQPLSSDFF